MDAATALYASAAVLLVLAGVVKMARPANTAGLLDALVAPSFDRLNTTRLAFGLGVFEIVLGLAALVAEIAAVAVVVGVLYGVFAVIVWRAMRIGAGTCGCFGRVDAPPSWWHVVGNGAFAACSFVAAAGRSPLAVMEGQPFGGLGFVVLVGVLAGLALVVFTAIPEAMEARRSTARARS